MRVDLFSYELPAELIAQRPAERREAARLLVLDSSGDAKLDAGIGDLPDLLPAGAVLVVNDTRVVPARLLGHKTDTGGRVEIFLVSRLGTRAIEVGGETREADTWRAMGKASKALRVGMDIAIAGRDGRA